jgi:hypothetical protein
LDVWDLRRRGERGSAVSVQLLLHAELAGKFGFKKPKHISGIEIGNEFTGGYRETYGYNWFSGL